MLFLCIKPLDLREVAQSKLKKKGPRQQGEDCLGHGVSKRGSTWQPVVPDAGHAHVEHQKLPCGMPVATFLAHRVQTCCQFCFAQVSFQL